jgi:hypothetical protein
VRTHRAAVARRALTPTQAFAHLAARRPERRVYRHPPSWLKQGQHAAETTDHDAAIQNTVTPAASAEASHNIPSLRPLELLVSVQAQILSHDGFAHRSPRAPPAFS